MAIFQVIHAGETYLVDGDALALQAEFVEAARAGGAYVTFQAAKDYDSDGPVSIFVSESGMPTVVSVGWES